LNPSVGRNLVAGALGNTWTALVQVAFVPAYIALLGLEAYGLIGVYAVLQMSLWLLDMGFTPALSREVARAQAGATRPDAVRDLLRSVEAIFAVVGIAIVVVVAVAAPWIAGHWLRSAHLDGATAIRALDLMGVLVALRLVANPYRGVISGAQRLVWLNGASALFATARGALVIPVLWVEPSIEAFFVFQALAGVLEAVVLARKAWQLLPGSRRAALSLQSVRSIAALSSGVTAIALLQILITQSDKALLSGMLPLAAFGEYSLASSVAGAIALLVAPVGAVAFPRLNALAVQEGAIAGDFHAFAQLVSVAVAPAGLVLAAFAHPILETWTADTLLAAGAAPLLALLATGAVLNAFMTIPILVPLAKGRPRGAIWLHAVLAAAFLPALYAGVARYGAIAAGYAWIGVYAAGVLLSAALVRAELGPAHAGRWLLVDVAMPALAAAAIILLVHAAWPGAFLVAFALAQATALAAAPRGRRWLSLVIARKGSAPSATGASSNGDTSASGRGG
jgi:O-antigen/teichoic acid export membrane protein